jgi:hypothetical protein
LLFYTGFAAAAAPLAKIITRTMRLLKRLGALIEEPDQTYLAETDTDGALKTLQAASCTYRIGATPFGLLIYVTKSGVVTLINSP